MLQTYVTIWWMVSDTYGVDTTQINMMSLVYAMFYIPGSMLSIYLYAKFGLSHCLIGGAVLNFLAVWIRCIGGFSYNAPDVVDVYGMYDGMYAAANTSALPYPITDSKAAGNAFSVQLFGQIIAAISQPLLLNAPPRLTDRVHRKRETRCPANSPSLYLFSLLSRSTARIANDWFPKGERDLVMHLMTQSNNIGGGFGSIIPAYQVYSGRSISFMLLWQALAGTGILALSFFVAPFRPPVHAEYDAYHQEQLRKSVDVSTVLTIFRQMLTDFRTMLSDVNFVLLLTAFSVQTGISWVFLAIIGQLIGPCGYETSIVGAALSGLGFAGVFGSFLLANVLRVWHRGYNIVQKVCFIVCGGMCLWCLGANQPGNAANVVAAYIMYGMISCPLTPIALEYAAEMTYPIPADNSAALLFTGVNYVFLAVTLGVGPLLATDPVSLTCSSITSQAAIVIMVFTIFGAVVALPMKANYRRTAVTVPCSEDETSGLEKGGDQQVRSPMNGAEPIVPQ